MTVTILPSQPPSPTRRAPGPRAALALVAGVLVIGVVLAFMTGLFGGSSPKAAGTSAQAPVAATSQRQAAADTTMLDARMRIDLRNLAVVEETYLTDNGRSYGKAAALSGSYLSSIALAPGQTITIHLAGSNGYCLAGAMSRDMVDTCLATSLHFQAIGW